MKCADVFIHKNHVYLEPMSKTDRGLWMSTPPYTKLPASVPAGELCSALRSTLDASKDCVPYPEEPMLADPAFLQLVGVSSWYTLAEKAELCSIRFDDKCWQFKPHRYMGRREGYCAISDEAITLGAGATAEKVARAILQCLEISAKARPLSVRVKRK